MPYVALDGRNTDKVHQASRRLSTRVSGNCADTPVRKRDIWPPAFFFGLGTMYLEPVRGSM